MDRLESLLSDTLAERAAEAPTGPLSLAPAPRRRFAAITILACLTVVLAMVAVAILAVLLRSPVRVRQSAQRSTPPTRFQVPAGMRLASYGQASVEVPAGLVTRTSLCGGPVANQVVADEGSAQLCPVATASLATHPGVVVWLSDTRQVSPYDAIATSPASADGHPARRGYAHGAPGLGSGISGVVRLTGQGITIGATAPTRRQVDSLLSSIRVARFDELGCAAALSSATKTAPGPSAVLIPASPTDAVRCEYGFSGGSAAGLLIGSYVLDSAATDRLADALNALVPDPCKCLHGGTPAPAHVEVLYFHFQGGTVLRISGTIGANLDSYSNLHRTVADYSDSIVGLLARLTNQR